MGDEMEALHPGVHLMRCIHIFFIILSPLNKAAFSFSRYSVKWFPNSASLILSCVPFTFFGFFSLHRFFFFYFSFFFSSFSFSFFSFFFFLFSFSCTRKSRLRLSNFFFFFFFSFLLIYTGFCTLSTPLPLPSLSLSLSPCFTPSALSLSLSPPLPFFFSPQHSSWTFSLIVRCTRLQHRTCKTSRGYFTSTLR